MKGRIVFIPFSETMQHRNQLGKKNASTRFRCYQNSTALEKLGWQCEIGANNALQADFVIFQKRYQKREQELAKKCKGKIILDLSDPDWIKWPNRQKDLINMANLAHCITTSSTKLAKYFQKRGYKAKCIPEGFDFNTIPPPIKKEPRTTICWHGNSGNERYLNILVEPLNKLSKEFDFNLKIIVNPPASEIPKFKFNPKVIEWKLETHLEEIAKCHIGISPLFLDEWCSYKNPHKMLTYMALGLPAVGTAIPSYKEIIINKVNGFIIENNDPNSWYSILRTLLSNESDQSALIKEQRKLVEKFSLGNMAKEWDNLLENL